MRPWRSELATFRKGDKICGPGNAWVAEAKRLVSGLPGGPAIDMPAGPSELMVIADEHADAGLVAADLLSQAEHDAGCAGVARDNIVGTGERRRARGRGRDCDLAPASNRQSIARSSHGSSSSTIWKRPSRSRTCMRPSTFRSRSNQAGGARSADPQRGRRIRRAPRRRDVRRLSRRVEPRASDRRRRSRLGRRVGLHLPQGDERADGDAKKVPARIAPASGAARPHGRARGSRPSGGRAPGASRMSSLAERLARPEILSLEEFDIAANNPLAVPDAIKLDANENPISAAGGGTACSEREPLSRTAAGEAQGGACGAVRSRVGECRHHPRRRRCDRHAGACILPSGDRCRRDLHSDLLGLFAFRPGAGRTADRNAAHSGLRLRRRRLPRRGAATKRTSSSPSSARRTIRPGTRSIRN